MEWVTTTVVLERLARDDSSAWESFVERFRLPVERFVREFGLSADEAEDVAQETLSTFVLAFRDRKYDRNRGRLRSWLFGIARRTALRSRRLAARRRQVTPNVQKTGFWDDVPDVAASRRSWDRSWDEAVFQLCLDRVRSEVQTGTMRAFEAVALEQRQPADVARELGMTSNAVFIAKHRVLKRIRELQQKFEVGS